MYNNSRDERDRYKKILLLQYADLFAQLHLLSAKSRIYCLINPTLIYKSIRKDEKGRVGMKWNSRLDAVASLIIPNRKIADIGTDHAYIPVYMCSKGLCPKAVAADIGQGPLEAAKSHVRAAGLEDVIDCRLGDGLTCLLPHETDGAVIAGMGGILIVKILSASPDVWRSMEFLVLQPQSDTAEVRRFLYEQGWHIDDERLVIDDGRLYEVMRAVQGRADLPPEWLYDVGPVNWERRDTLLTRKITHIIEKKIHIREGLKKSCRNMDVQLAEMEKEILFWRNKQWQLQSEKS